MGTPPPPPPPPSKPEEDEGQALEQLQNNVLRQQVQDSLQYGSMSDSLRRIWDQIGISTSEKEARFEKMFNELAGMMQKNVANAEAEAEAMKLDINDTECKIAQIKQKLASGELEQPSDSSATLVERVGVLHGRLKSLTEVMVSRSALLSGLHNSVSVLQEELGESEVWNTIFSSAISSF
jgi:predicted  nucleic acid-binding Zn-ribbon protein